MQRDGTSQNEFRPLRTAGKVKARQYYKYLTPTE